MTTAVDRKSIREVFAELAPHRRIGLMPFIPAGYPDLSTTAALLPALEAGGSNVIEIGIPFSDPIADGPVIQAAFTEALRKKIKLHEIFTAIAQARPKVTIPLVAMVSYSIVFRYGPERFVADSAAAGIDGIIIPDLPPPEAQTICAIIRAGGLDTILLVAPTTTPDRQKEIADLCSGFIYYLSVAGITGERDKLPPDLAANVRALKNLTPLPVCVGFGISRPDHVAQLAPFADGAIVGTAVVRRISQHLHESPESIADAVRNYCRELLSEVR